MGNETNEMKNLRHLLEITQESDKKTYDIFVVSEDEETHKIIQEVKETK